MTRSQTTRPSIFLIPILLLLGHMATAQAKYEKEYRLREQEVPASAMAFVEALPFSKKIRWYREEGLQRTSLEAKTRHESNKYSIEFDNSGKLEDIEVEITWKGIPEPVQKGIQQYLDTTYTRYRISKIQLQMKGTEPVLARHFQSGELPQEAEIRYELVLNARKEGEYQGMELLFSDQGKLEKQAIILTRNTDNLEY